MLRENGGIVTHACRDLKVSRTALYELRGRDEDFRKQWDEAVDEGIDALEDEAKRRAYEGCDEPIYQGGQLVGYKRNYSDTLMIRILAAHREKYRNKHELSGPGGEPLQTGPVIVLPDNHRGDREPDELDELEG